MTGAKRIGEWMQDDWQQKAACREYPYPDDFFQDPISYDRLAVKEAMAICLACPVRMECRQLGVVLRAPKGSIWGGVRRISKDEGKDN